MNYEAFVYYILLILTIFVGGRLAMDASYAGKLKHKLIEDDNKALGADVAGKVISLFILSIASISVSVHNSALINFAWSFGYAALGLLVVFSFISPFIRRTILPSEINELILGGNLSAGICSASVSVAIALIYCGVVGADNQFAHTPAIVFFFLGLIAFILAAKLYRYLTAYDDIQQIREDNRAVAVSYSSLIISVAIIVEAAVSGDFIDWNTSFIKFSIALADIALLYPIRQILIQGLFLGGGYKIYGGRLDYEIAKDKNIGAAFIEAAGYMGAAFLALAIM
jgi:uncharacterized membrane protein YjfL (UPF0719 family)